MWVWSGASGEYMRKPVPQWNNGDVINWLQGLGHWTHSNITQVFIDEVSLHNVFFFFFSECHYEVHTGHHGFSTVEARQNCPV